MFGICTCQKCTVSKVVIQKSKSNERVFVPVFYGEQVVTHSLVGEFVDERSQRVHCAFCNQQCTSWSTCNHFLKRFALLLVQREEKTSRTYWPISVLFLMFVKSLLNVKGEQLGCKLRISILIRSRLCAAGEIRPPSAGSLWRWRCCARLIIGFQWTKW